MSETKRGHGTATAAQAAACAPPARLFGIKHSHPVLAARMALELTGIPFEAHDLLPGVHGVIVRSRGFRGWTVPALEIGGLRVQGTLAIARELDRRAPETGLFPRDPERRSAVEEAERFGHDDLQPVARRVFRWAGARDSAVRVWMAREVIGAPAPTLVGHALMPVMVLFGRVISKADDEHVHEDLVRLPGLLERADALVASGTIGGGAPNAADLQILTSIRLLMAHVDLRPAIAGHPCAAAAARLIPDYPRSGTDALPSVPAALPPEWVRQAGTVTGSRAASTQPRRLSKPTPASTANSRPARLKST